MNCGSLSAPMLHRKLIRKRGGGGGCGDNDDKQEIDLQLQEVGKDRNTWLWF